MRIFRRSICYLVIIAICVTSASIIDNKTAKAAYSVGSTVYFGAYFQDWLTGNDEKYAMKLKYNDDKVAQIDDGRWVARWKHYSDDYYMSEPIEWKVLKDEGDSLLLLSKNVLTFINPGQSAGEKDQWANNKMRTWLNNDFLKYGFNAKEKGDILNSNVNTYYMSYTDWRTKGSGWVCGANEGGTIQTTTDKVFLLDKYDFNEMVSNDDKIGFGTKWACKKVKAVDWYLRGPATWVYGNLVNIYVTNTGAIDENRRVQVSAGSKGIRPAIRVKKNSKYLSTKKPKIKLQLASSNDNNKPLTTNVTAKYMDGGVDKEVTDTELYDDNYFLKWNSSNNNWKLASLSMLASATAYKKSYADTLIQKCGFKNHKYYSAKSDLWNHNKVSFEVAYRKVHNTYIVAVWVQGSRGIFKHPSDWISNFEVGRFGDIAIMKAHKGFADSEAYMTKKINSYLKNKVKLDKSGKVKIWITGHSRGGAIANIYAKRMNKLIDKSNVFAYTFASPKVKVGKIKDKTNYSNIFNYVNKNDLVPALPPGYKRYGRNTTFKITKKNNKKMKRIFKKLAGKKYYYKSLKKSKTLKKKKKAIKYAHCQTAYLAWLKAKSN